MTVPKALAFVALTITGLAASVSAQEAVFELDPAQTHIAFMLGSTLHTVHGAFQLRRGRVHFDPATGKASGELIVDAASGNSGSRSRDQRMHKSVLESQKYPDIAFRPDYIEGKIPTQGPATVQVHGIFSIHGDGHEITVPTQVQVEASQISATLEFSVPYVQWGMKNPSTFLLRVNDTAQIEVQTTFRIEPLVQPGI
jgi:polyisoprenoid-binding protein YceI